MGLAIGSKSVRFLSEGQDAVRYWIEFSPSVGNIKISKDGTTYPTSINATAMKQVGENTPVNANDCSLYYLKKKYSMPVEAETPYSSALPIDSSIEYFIFRLKKSGVKIYETYLMSIREGEDGAPGQDGAPGEDGKPGEDGQDAVSYDIEFSFYVDGNDNVVQSVPCDSYGNSKLGSTMLKAQLYRTVGAQREKITTADGLHIVFYGKDSLGSVLYTSQTSTTGLIRINVMASYFSMEAVATNPETNEELCRREIYKTYDGTQGLEGCIYRKTQWEEGKEYRNDSALTAPEAGELYRYIDIVGILEGETAYWFECGQTHTSTKSNQPKPMTTTVYWKPLNNLAPTYTPLILADNAELTLVGARQIVVKDVDDSGTPRIVLGMSGRAKDDEGQDTNVCFWIGPNPAAAENTMVINKDGVIMSRGTFAVKAQELGIVNSKELDGHDVAPYLKQYFDKNIFNFHGTCPVQSTGSRYGLLIPSLNVVNQTNTFFLYDGVEFSFFNQPVISGKLMTYGDVYFQSQMPIIWTRNFAGSFSKNNQEYGYNSNYRVHTLRLPAYAMLRMRSVRFPEINAEGKPTGSYALNWIILNSDEFFVKSINFIVQTANTVASPHVELHHVMCRAATTHTEAKEEGIEVTANGSPL